MLEQINAVQLTDAQQMMLSRFYDGLREAKSECRIDYATLERLAYTVIYEQDLAISIWQRLDDYLVKLRNDKLKADLDKQRLKR